MMVSPPDSAVSSDSNSRMSTFFSIRTLSGPVVRVMVALSLSSLLQVIVTPAVLPQESS